MDREHTGCGRAGDRENRCGRDNDRGRVECMAAAAHPALARCGDGRGTQPRPGHRGADGRCRRGQARLPSLCNSELLPDWPVARRGEEGRGARACGHGDCRAGAKRYGLDTQCVSGRAHADGAQSGGVPRRRTANHDRERIIERGDGAVQWGKIRGEPVH